MRAVFAATLALLAPGVTLAQPAAPAGPCRALALAVDSGLKDLAYTRFGSNARSAPQATQVATEQQNRIAMIGLNLNLMAAHRCPMPTTPISEMTYSLNALQCVTAELDDALGKGDGSKVAKCNRADWKPIGADAKPADKPAT